MVQTAQHITHLGNILECLSHLIYIAERGICLLQKVYNFNGYNLYLKSIFQKVVISCSINLVNIPAT